MKLFSRRKNHPSSPHAVSATGEATAITRAIMPSRRSAEIVKRRVVVNLALLDRPLMTEVTFTVDTRYRHLKMLGSGSFAVVVRADDAVTGRRVAIKKILGAFSNAHMARHVLREVRLLRHLKHPHIVRLLDVDVPSFYSSWNDVYLVTPLLRTDLKGAMKEGLVSEVREQKRIAYQLLLALRHLHAVGVMHRDVKTWNILLDDSLNVQLCDLGEARFHSQANPAIETEAPELEPQLTGGISTMVVSAPEIVLGGDYDVEVDIWAAGCVIAELATPGHKELFERTSRTAHVKEIVEVIGFPPEEVLKRFPESVRWYLRRVCRGREQGKLGEIVGGDVGDLVEKMLRFDPRERISAEDALKHEWFDEVRDATKEEWEKYEFALSEPPRGIGKGKLKEMVWEEVVAFHPEAVRDGR